MVGVGSKTEAGVVEGAVKSYCKTSAEIPASPVLETYKYCPLALHSVSYTAGLVVLSTPEFKTVCCKVNAPVSSSKLKISTSRLPSCGDVAMRPDAGW